MWPFRRSETPPNATQRHEATLGLIEDLAALRAKVNGLVVEWEDVKTTVQKSYQRVERANQRAERRLGDGPEGDGAASNGSEGAAALPLATPQPELRGFAKKLAERNSG